MNADCVIYDFAAENEGWGSFCGRCPGQRTRCVYSCNMENYSLTTIDSPQIPRITIFFKITIDIDQDPIWALRLPAVFSQPSKTTSKRKAGQLSHEEKARLLKIAKRPRKGPLKSILDPLEYSRDRDGGTERGCEEQRVVWCLGARGGNGCAPRWDGNAAEGGHQGSLFPVCLVRVLILV